MRPAREELDEAIDRVAAAMTFAPVDPARAAQVANGIRPLARSTVPWLGAATAVAAIALAVAAITMWRIHPAEQVAATVSRGPEWPAPKVDRPRPEQPVKRQAGATRTPREAPRAERARLQVQSAIVPQIAALPLPDVLEVDELPTPSLTIAPVDLAPLDVANLEVTELASGDDDRE